MGSYCQLEIAGHGFLGSKSYVDDVLMTLFDESDRQVTERRIDDADPDSAGPDDEPEFETLYQYRLDAAGAKHRLDILGFTVARARDAFEHGIQELLSVDDDEGSSFYCGPSWLDEGDERRSFVESLAFERWGEGLREFLASGIVAPLWGENAEKESRLDPLVRFIAGAEWDEDFLYGFPRCDPRLFMRAVLEFTDESIPVVLDYSDLVYGGYYEEPAQLARNARASIQREFVATARTIVLTEGSTDSEFLSKSLAALYPHLVPLYSFIDFAGPNMEGGTGNLVRIVKGFIGCGVANRVIAIFDNDTAAADALRSLESVDLPEHFRILQYPRLPYADDYPTIGPQGQANLDVNGLAGSIELYFGLDVLRNDGQAMPVQWKGFIAPIGKYQGEVLDKRRLQQQFRRKVESTSDPREARESPDWIGMRLILESIFVAFDAEEAHRPEAPTN